MHHQGEPRCSGMVSADHCSSICIYILLIFVCFRGCLLGLVAQLNFRHDALQQGSANVEGALTFDAMQTLMLDDACAFTTSDTDTARIIRRHGTFQDYIVKCKATPEALSGASNLLRRFTALLETVVLQQRSLLPGANATIPRKHFTHLCLSIHPKNLLCGCVGRLKLWSAALPQCRSRSWWSYISFKTNTWHMACKRLRDCSERKH